MIRPTIAEVARQAGVSTSAVSYALNGKPGVSEDTRNRVLAVAADLGWRPSSAARALAGSQVGSVGLVLNRPARLLGLEPFYMEFISGAQEVLGPREFSLVLQVVGSTDDEFDVYRRWAASRKVDGVLLTDLVQDDPRPQLLRSLDVPAIITAKIGGDWPQIWSDDASAMNQVVRYLAALGHRHIARVAGTPSYIHCAVRTKVFDAQVAELGLDEPLVVTTDFSREQGIRATRQILTSMPRPTAIIYDNDVMAAAGLGVAMEMGVKVPENLSIVAWDDSLLSQLTYPSLTSVNVDVRTYAMRATNGLLDLLNGVEVTSGLGAQAQLEIRGSTAAR